jgi:serine/threonine protein kinase
MSKHISHIGDFSLGKSLGEGTFGKVVLGTHIPTGEKVNKLLTYKVAIKILDKLKILDESDRLRIDREINILKSLRHHNIVQIYTVIETSTSIYIVMEYASGGELFKLIVLKKRLSEYEACRYFQQIVSGVEYLHKLNIAHRDLKPENLLLDVKRNLKIVDFGLSNTYTDKLRTPCGSPCYAAPEMLQNKPYIGSKVDIWSIGIVLYAMVCGYLPFDEKNDDLLFKKITTGKYAATPKFLSANLRDLISKILETNPEKRITFDQIKKHPWFSTSKPICTFHGFFVRRMIIPVDDAVLEILKDHGYEPDIVRNDLLANKHNHITTIYYLIVKSLNRGGVGSISDLNSKKYIQYIKCQSNIKQDCALDRQTDGIEFKTIYEFTKNTIAENQITSQEPLQTDNYLVCENNSSEVQDDEVGICTEGGEMIKTEGYSDFFNIGDGGQTGSVIANSNLKSYIQNSIKSKLKKQYDRFIKTGAKVGTFKKGFLNTSALYEGKPDKEYRNRTYDSGRARSPIVQIMVKKRMKGLNTSCPEINEKDIGRTPMFPIKEVDEFKKKLGLKGGLGKLNPSLDHARSDRSHSTNSTRPKQSTYRCVSECSDRKPIAKQSLYTKKPCNLKVNRIPKIKQIQKGALNNTIMLNYTPVKQGDRNKTPIQVRPKNISIYVETYNGPIDINTVSTKQPDVLFDNILASLTNNKLTFKQSKVYISLS